jgi:hypothetical protein
MPAAVWPASHRVGRTTTSSPIREGRPMHSSQPAAVCGRQTRPTAPISLSVDSRALYYRRELGRQGGNWADGSALRGTRQTHEDENHYLAKLRVAGSNPVIRSIRAGQRFLNRDVLPRVTRPVGKNSFLALSTAILSVLSCSVHGTAAWSAYPGIGLGRPAFNEPGVQRTSGSPRHTHFISRVKTISILVHASHANLRLIFHRS